MILQLRGKNIVIKFFHQLRNFSRRDNAKQIEKLESEDIKKELNNIRTDKEQAYKWIVEGKSIKFISPSYGSLPYATIDNKRFNDFCHIDDHLIEIIKQYAGNRIIVDCGCGSGLLEYLLGGEVVSIDEFGRCEGSIFGPLINDIICTDASDFPFVKNFFAIFLRPSGDIFVKVIEKHMNNIVDCFLVTKPQNYDAFTDFRISYENNKTSLKNLIKLGKISVIEIKDRLETYGEMIYYFKF